MKAGSAGLGGEFGDPQVLRRAGRGRVPEQDADAERPVGQIGRQAGQQRGDLRGLRRALPGRVGNAGHEGVQARVRRQAGHRLHPGQRPGGGETVIDRPSLCGGAAVGVGDRGDARLELQRGGDAVHGLQPQAAEVADVTVQVDKSGRHDLPRHVDIDSGRRQSGPDRGDLAVRHGDIPHRVQPRFWIDHPAAAQHHARVAHRRLLGTSVPGVVGC